MKHIWTMLMHKVLQTHLLRAFVANLKIDAIYALYPESFYDKKLAIRKVFAFCVSAPHPTPPLMHFDVRSSGPLGKCLSFPVAANKLVIVILQPELLLIVRISNHYFLNTSHLGCTSKLNCP